MNAIEVVLAVPDWVQSGLSLGQFERVGGVIRETATGRVVAWLRDGAVSLPNNAAVPSSVLQMAGSLAGAGFLVNLALTASSLSAVLVRLDNLQNAISSLATEFDRDRAAALKNALEDARDAVEMSNADARLQRANGAISDLRKAGIQLHQSFVESNAAQKYVASASFLLRETYCLTAMVRCYLEVGEAELALQRLGEKAGPLLAKTQELVGLLLGEHPAVYLHATIPGETVRRFVRVQEWLAGKAFTDILIDTLRRDFWNDDALEAENALLKELSRRLRRTTVSAHDTRLEHLALVESLIESIRRVEGFELELRSMRLMGLSFPEWSRLSDSDFDFAVLLPPEPVEIRR